MKLTHKRLVAIIKLNTVGYRKHPRLLVLAKKNNLFLTSYMPDCYAGSAFLSEEDPLWVGDAFKVDEVKVLINHILTLVDIC